MSKVSVWAEVVDRPASRLGRARLGERFSGRARLEVEQARLGSRTGPPRGEISRTDPPRG